MSEILHEWNRNGSLLPPCFQGNFAVVSMGELLDQCWWPRRLVSKVTATTALQRWTALQYVHFQSLLQQLNFKLNDAKSLFWCLFVCFHWFVKSCMQRKAIYLWLSFSLCWPVVGACSLMKPGLTASISVLPVLLAEHVWTWGRGSIGVLAKRGFDPMYRQIDL